MGILNAFAEARIIDPISKGVRKWVQSLLT
jgi:hypothetical protein